MNKTLFTFAAAAAFAAGSAFADVVTNTWENFEGYTIGDAITNAVNRKWSADGADESVIAADNGGKVLQLKTEGSTLTRALDDPSAVNDAIAGGSTVVFESEIKFVPSDSLNCGEVEEKAGTDDTKFAIYAYAPDGGPTNLVVFHASDVGVYTNEVIDVVGALDDPDAYTKVTVRVFVEPTNPENGLFFTVALNDGEPLEHAENAYSVSTDDGGDYGFDPTWFKTVNGSSDGDDAFSAICFKGTGAVDNLSVGTAEEDEPEEEDDWAQDVSEVTGNASAAYPSLAGSAFASVNASNLTVWATANSVSFDAVKEEQDADSNLAQAFLLNCDPDDVADEAKEFVATITIDKNGNIVVTPPADKDYNVTPQLKGKASLSDADWYDLGDYDSADTDGYQFFMLELSL